MIIGKISDTHMWLNAQETPCNYILSSASVTGSFENCQKNGTISFEVRLRKGSWRNWVLRLSLEKVYCSLLHCSRHFEISAFSRSRLLKSNAWTYSSTEKSFLHPEQNVIKSLSCAAHGVHCRKYLVFLEGWLTSRHDLFVEACLLCKRLIFYLLFPSIRSL